MEEQALYKIITTHDQSLTAAVNALAEEVNTKIQEGWLPLGGLALATVPDRDGGGGHFIYSQAMVWGQNGDDGDA